MRSMEADLDTHWQLFALCARLGLGQPLDTQTKVSTHARRRFEVKVLDGHSLATLQRLACIGAL